MRTAVPRRASGSRVSGWPLVWWFTTGAALGIGAISILTIGAPIVLLGAVFLIIGLMRPALVGRSVAMIMVGLAAAPATLAWLNRGGPGAVCNSKGATQTCVDAWNPWPFVAIALLLVGIGLIFLLRRPGPGPGWHR